MDKPLVCAAWPVRRQTYGYLPGRRASPPFGRCQIVLLGNRGTWVLTCPELLPDGAPAGSQTRDLSVTSHTCEPLHHQATQQLSHFINYLTCIFSFALSSGRCSIVDYCGQILCDIYARPDEPITDYRTRYSGLRPRDMIHAIPVDNARNIIKNIIRVSY